MTIRRIASALTFRKPAPRVAILRLAGIIGPLGPLRGGLSLASVDAVIERAFALKDAQAVALTINSPGGAPAQSALIHNRIRQFAEENKRPVFAFAEDVAASGGYWLACAADEIFVERNSIVGSIGVISSGFGFHEAIERLGVERRLHTQGERKSRLDPFRPEKSEDVVWLDSVQAQIHDNFKALVRDRRAGKLRTPEEVLFSGEIWVGAKAVEAGLADGVGDVRGTLRERFGKNVKLIKIEPEKSWLRRRLGLARTAPGPADWVEQALDGLEARALWSRYGL